jgi:hypothetical protein
MHNGPVRSGGPGGAAINKDNHGGARKKQFFYLFGFPIRPAAGRAEIRFAGPGYCISLKLKACGGEVHPGRELQARFFVF